MLVVVAEGERRPRRRGRRGRRASCCSTPTPGEGPITSLRARRSPRSTGRSTASPTSRSTTLWSRPDTVAPAPGRGPGSGAPLTLPTHEGERGHPARLPGQRSSRSSATRSLEGGAQTVVHRHLADALLVEVDDPGVLIDIDTPDAYESVLAETGRGGAPMTLRAADVGRAPARDRRRGRHRRRGRRGRWGPAGARRAAARPRRARRAATRAEHGRPRLAGAGRGGARRRCARPWPTRAPGTGCRTVSVDGRSRRALSGAPPARPGAGRGRCRPRGPADGPPRRPPRLPGHGARRPAGLRHAGAISRRGPAHPGRLLAIRSPTCPFTSARTSCS